MHLYHGGKIIEFGGWALPVQYKSIIEEHNKVREAAGLFDVSHMGRIIIEGSGAEGFIQQLITNDLNGVEDGRAIYSPVCYPHGGTVDDIVVYKFKPGKYMLVVNASNAAKDLAWLMDHKDKAVNITDISADTIQLAVQGPDAAALMQKITGYDLSKIKYYRFADNITIDGILSIISRTGYTGEDGFEVYTGSNEAERLWQIIMKAGEEYGLVPVGLGARDTLRMEAGMPLYGHELSESITPLQANLDRFIKFDKPDFVGKQALMAQVTTGVPRRIFGFEMTEPGVPRPGYKVYCDSGDRMIENGIVTSGGYSPTLNKNIGLMLVDSYCSTPGMRVYIGVRDRSISAKTVEYPFYRRKKVAR